MEQKDKKRFWRHVNKKGSYPDRTACKHYPEIKGTRCWEWTGSVKTERSPYGRFGYKGKMYISHRFAWRIIKKERLRSTTLLLHKCDNPRCVRDLHLFKGNHKKNMADMTAKHRQAVGDRNGSRLYPERLPRGDEHFSHKHPELVAHGERNRHAKLTEHDVRKIRKLWKTGNYFQRELADKYNVLQTTIGRIVTNATWRFI